MKNRGPRERKLTDMNLNVHVQADYAHYRMETDFLLLWVRLKSICSPEPGVTLNTLHISM